MLGFLSYNKNYFNSIEFSYRKNKINYFFFNFKFIIYINIHNNFILKNKILNNNVYNLMLKENYVKALFNIPYFSFLSNNKLLCIFTNDITLFLNIIKLLENKQFFYSYKNCLSNIILNFNVLLEFNKYNINYIYIQFIIKKIKIKIILLLFFFLFSLIRCIK